MTIHDIMARLEPLRNEANLAGMARYGITINKALGVTMPVLHELRREAKGDHPLALALWQEGYRETRILAALVDDYRQVTEEQMEEWVKDFDSWEVVDQVCTKLFWRTPWAVAKVYEWAEREAEYERRAGFVLMCGLAVHHKKLPETELLAFLPLIEQYSTDPRNFVKKAVNWALRQIGKRSLSLHTPALHLAASLARSQDKTARWIGRDAQKELEKPDLIARLTAKADRK